MIRRIAARSPTSSCKKIRSAVLLKGTTVYRTTVRRRLVHDFNLKALKPAKKPPSVMMWGAMSSDGTAGLFFLPTGTSMNGVRYRKMSEYKHDIHMTSHECITFMHDGAPCHRSKLVSYLLQKQNIKRLDWLRNSPDLNPIENLWAISSVARNGGGL